MKRIGHRLDNMGRIDVEKLIRKADLETLLRETHCHEIHGAHISVFYRKSW
ncbi:MAG: hypothetical protein M3362_00965 [Acidobacteriota bacterium]|nr:hypothetical protein [Acidobacteriota bacterium]